MDSIIIGKHALESLTIGMYADPFVVFREYIQNAADAIDDAIANKIISCGEEKIEVILEPLEREIIIIDNGIGIPCLETEKTLIGIGNSKKDQGSARGFRGIGRLAALSYCGKLIFETSSYLEKCGTRLCINAHKLTERLLQKENDDVSAEEVLKDVYSVEIYKESENAHYFKVIMEELEAGSELTDYNAVYRYLSQNAPVTYDSFNFIWGKEIKSRIENIGYCIPEYDVVLTYAGNSTHIHKPYQDKFPIDKNGNIIDSIKDIEIITLRGSKGEVSTFGWIANTDYLGSIYNKDIKGLRVRKGNILIGDGQTLNTSFKDARFNGWVLGELFVVDEQLIPNARRDDFEKNSEYLLWKEKLMSISANISRNIRSASLSRNVDTLNATGIHRSEEKEDEELRNTGEDDLGLKGRSELKRRLINTRIAIDAFSKEEVTERYHGEIPFEELDMLIGKIQGITAYKILNSLESIGKKEKKVLEKVFDIIISVQPDNSEIGRASCRERV